MKNMKKIFINIQAKIDNFDENYKWAFLDIKNKYDLKIFNFYIKWNIKNKDIEKLKKSWINMIEYIDEKDLLNKVNSLKKPQNNYFFNTYTENLILIVNKIKKSFWQKITEQPELFRNKKLQRELLLKYNKEITVNYFEEKIWKLNFVEIKNKIWSPFILKPKNWVQSSWVLKIENEYDLENYKCNNDQDNNILVEEFIDWTFFNINYYVNEKQDIFLVNPIREIVAVEYWIKDFFSPVRLISKDTLNIVLKYDIKKFVKDSVISCWIKNTFVHQEFKITSKNEIKNIELNWRIWWYRMEMYNFWYWINLLDLIFNKKDNYWIRIKTNFAGFTLYPDKNWILKSYNYELLKEIKKLKSFKLLEIFPNNFEWKKVWLTKYWFKKLWKIRLENKNYKEFKKDYDFIKRNYKNLLILE